MCVCVCVLSHYVHPLLSGLSFSPTDYCECVSSCDFCSPCRAISRVFYHTVFWARLTGTDWSPSSKEPRRHEWKKTAKERGQSNIEAGGLLVLPARYFSLISTLPSFFAPCFSAQRHYFSCGSLRFTSLSFFLPFSVCTFCLFHSLPFCLSNATHLVC